MFLFISVEAKQGHPISRTGSDRRPDAVREEGLKHQESTGVSESVFHSDVAHENLIASTSDRLVKLLIKNVSKFISSSKFNKFMLDILKFVVLISLISISYIVLI